MVVAVVAQGGVQQMGNFEAWAEFAWWEGRGAGRRQGEPS